MGCQGPKTGTDTCDGEVINLTLGSSFTLCGSIDATTGADYVGSACLPTSPPSKDRVYEVNTTGQGILTIDVRADEGSDLDPFAHLNLQGSCGVSSPGASGGCFDGFPVRIDWDSAFSSGFHMIVEGGVDANLNPLVGDYVVELSLQPPVCGDWVVAGGAPPEQCDDGNTANGDGCNSSCQLEATGATGSCPGLPIFAPALPRMEPGSTHFATDDHTPPATGTCVGATAGAADAVYRFTAASSGLVTATVGLDATCTQTVCSQGGPNADGCWDQVIWVREGSCNGNVLGCANAVTQGAEMVTFNATQGTDYFVFVDGAGAQQSGMYYLCLL